MARFRLPLAVVLLLFIAIASLIVWMTSMPSESYRGPLRPTAGDVEVAARLRTHVEALASAPRSLWSDGLDRSVDYLSRAAREMGREPMLHTYSFSGADVSNVEIEIRGNTRPEEIVIVGAHYDTVDESPGADDNASGVAAVLELLRDARPGSLTVRYVFFVNEEPPYFQTERMGSLVYADRSREQGENVVAMISVESIGWYSDVQSYPPGLGLLYPERGDFIAFVGDLSSRDLVRSTIEDFRIGQLLPSEGLAAPLLVPGVGWSDHWSFAVNGYPAVMVTDTALFRNPHYHTDGDRPDTLDYERMALVVRGLFIVILSLACDEDCPI